MSGLVPWQTDSIQPERPAPVHITVDGMSVEGLQGQSLAGILLAQDRTAWRTTVAGRGRGVFCGIGVCFDCIATVNGESDVRLCMRRARDGDTVETQDDTAQPDTGQAGSRRAVAATDVSHRAAAPADATHPATGTAGTAARGDAVGSEDPQGDSGAPGNPRDFAVSPDTSVKEEQP
ncbi:(2Fe-2S)-binding protein [Glycomyces dulcitolivorans]|uniref:(2Fe-2S)-binding protein n=1 Tax=Glycomyces dulcitolivorans TaxID=2200759 RepID=UPI000DD2BD40|nr:(2Fe-2S)-binding protein [Glycomyces dulcitolivorans]